MPVRNPFLSLTWLKHYRVFRFAMLTFILRRSIVNVIHDVSACWSQIRLEASHSVP